MLFPSNLGILVLLSHGGGLGTIQKCKDASSSIHKPIQLCTQARPDRTKKVHLALYKSPSAAVQNAIHLFKSLGGHWYSPGWAFLYSWMYPYMDL